LGFEPAEKRRMVTTDNVQGGQKEKRPKMEWVLLPPKMTQGIVCVPRRKIVVSCPVGMIRFVCGAATTLEINLSNPQD